MLELGMGNCRGGSQLEGRSRLRRNLEEWCWSENDLRGSAEVLEQAITEKVHKNREGHLVEREREVV